MFKKSFLTAVVLTIIALSFIFVEPGNAALETQLLVDVSPSSDNVPYQKTQWYGFTATGGNGYCAILSPSSGNADLYLFDTNFSLRAISKNTGTTVDKVWYGQSTTGPFHLASYGAYNPSSNFTIQVITAPYVSTMSPTSGASGTLVTIYGFGFGATQGTSYVKFGTVQATSYYSWTNTQIKVYVPSGIAGGVLQVVAYVSSKASNPMNFTAPANSSDGTMWRYDLARTANYLNGPTGLPLNLKWKYYTDWGLDTSPTIANNIIYFTTPDGLSALDANTGAFKWLYPVAGSSPPAVAGGTVYYGNGGNTLYAVDANTGTLKWKYVDPYGGYIYSTPAVLNGVVYFSTTQRFYALDANNGSVKWAYTTGWFSSAAISNDMVYFGDNSGKIYALYATNGAVKWTYTITNGSLLGIPAVANGILYFGAAWTGGGGLYALDANTGALKWKSYNYGVRYLAVSNGVVYTSGGPYGQLYAFDANTGALKWSSSLSYTAPIVSNGLVFISGYDNNLYAIDANIGTVKWNFAINGNGGNGTYHSPVIYNGKVYTTSTDGNIYCFGQ